MHADNNPFLLRLEKEMAENDAADWGRKYFEAQDTIRELRLEVQKLTSMPEALRRQYEAQAREQLEEARRRAGDASTNLRKVEELYKTREQELQESIQSSILKFKRASDEAGEAEAILKGLESKITSLMDDAIEANKKKNRTKNLVFGFAGGVLTSLVASAIFLLATGSLT